MSRKKKKVKKKKSSRKQVKKYLERTQKLLNQLEKAGQNPTPIRRPPDKKGEHSVVGFTLKEGTLQFNPSKQKWVVVTDFVPKFPEFDSEK